MSGILSWSRRRAVRRAIADAGLPSAITGFIERVVVRARLRGGESADVAAELASHFAEGLAGGRGADELVRLYGDPKRSARELRRSAIAKRGVLDRSIGALFVWGGRAVLAFVALYAVSAVALSMKRPVLSVDAIAALRAAMPAPGPEGRAIDLYREALADAEGRFDLESRAATLATLHDDIARLEFDAAARERARAMLGSIEDRVAILRRLRERPAFGASPGRGGLSTDDARFLGLEQEPAGDAAQAETPPALAEVLLPQLSLFRGAAHWLASDAAMAAHDGRTADLVADLESMAALAGHADEIPTLIGALVAISVRIEMLATLVSAIENHAEDLDDASLARLDALARAQRVDFGRAFDAERLFQLDVVQRCYSDDGDGSGVLLVAPASSILGGFVTGEPRGAAVPATLAFLAGPLAAAVVPGRAEVERRIDRIFEDLDAALAAPTRREAVERIARQETERSGRGRSSLLLGGVVDLLMPALGRSIGQVWRLDAERESAVAAVAIERFRRENGRFPADLGELRRAAGVEVGAWWEDRQPWRYALVDGRPLVYDCGVDLLDDRARTAITFFGEREPEVSADALSPRYAWLAIAGGAGETADDAAMQGFARSATRIAPDAPLDPARPVLDDDPLATWIRAGDAVRVWWRSGAAGPSRIVLAHEPRPLGDMSSSDSSDDESSGASGEVSPAPAQE